MLYLLPSPIGNLSDITLRVLEILQKGEVFLCEDTRLTRKLLSLLEQKGFLLQKERRFFSFHSHNQDDFFDKLDPSFFDPIVIFMSDAGMPCISDPGSMLVRYAQQFGLPYEVLPGGSASTLVYCYSGFGDGGFVFDGFLPHKRAERRMKLLQWREILSAINLPLIAFEAPHRIFETLQDLREIDEECEVFAIKEMTKKFERFFRGKVENVLCQIQGQNLHGEWALVLRFSSLKCEKKIGSAEVMELDIPPKVKAKILSKITDLSSKDWYEKLLGDRM